MAGNADYDAPRRPVLDVDDTDVDGLRAGGFLVTSPAADIDDPDAIDDLEPAGGEMTDGELTAKVVPMMADEFRCSRCFLVHHRGQLAERSEDEEICRECA